MSLTTLPPELFSCIAAHIKSRPALCNLARCSRQFYLCTIPHLYHHVAIKQKEHDDKLRNLASVLIRRPDLAGLVRSFDYYEDGIHSFQCDGCEVCEGSGDSECSEGPGEFEESGGSVRSKTVEVDEVFKAAVNALSLPEMEGKEWLRQLGHTNKGHIDLILALLLPALPKVEELYLAYKMKFRTHYYLERILRKAVRKERPFDTQPAFQALTDFGHYDECFEERCTSFIALLLKLPAIRGISGGFGNKRGSLCEDENLIELDRISSPLTFLDLRAFFSTEDLGHILRAPKALKTFFYSSDYLNFTAVRYALGPQQDCLERLGFDQLEDSEFDYSCGTDEYFGPMTSFASFNTIKFFKTAAIFLQQTDNGTKRRRLINIFPSNLETLHLTCCAECSESILKALEYLLAQDSPEQISSLEEIILTYFSPKFEKGQWNQWSTERAAIERLSKVAAARGVSIELL